MTTEADIEKYLVDEVKRRGGEIRKVKWVRRSFAPDRRVMLPRYSIPYTDHVSKARAFWVECKEPDYKITPRVRAQFREHARMRERGEVVYICDSYTAVVAALAGL